MNGRIDDPFSNAPELLRDVNQPAESSSMIDASARRADTLLRDVVALHGLLEFTDVAQQLLDLLALRFPGRNLVLLWREDDGTLRHIGRTQADMACEGRAREASEILLQRERSEFLQGDDPAAAPVFICVPMRCRGKKVGSLYLEDAQRQSAFAEDEIQHLDALARHAGVALANARVHERLQGDVRDLRVAVRVSRGMPERHSEAPSAPRPGAVALPRPETPAAAHLERPVQPLSDIERDAILHALRENRGNRTAAAAALGISVRKLQYKIKEYQQEGFDVPRS